MKTKISFSLDCTSIDIHISLNGFDHASCGSQKEQCRSINYALLNSTITQNASPDSIFSVYLDPGKNSQFAYTSNEIHFCSNLRIFSSYFTTSNLKPILENVKINFCLNTNWTNSTGKFIAKTFDIDSVDLHNVSITTHGKISSVISNATIMNNETFYKMITYSEAAANMTFKSCKITVINKIIEANSFCGKLSDCKINSISYILVQNTTINNGYFEINTTNTLDVIDSQFVGVNNISSFAILTFNSPTTLRVSRSKFIRNNVKHVVYCNTLGNTTSEVAIINSYFADNTLEDIALGRWY